MDRAPTYVIGTSTMNLETNSERAPARHPMDDSDEPLVLLVRGFVVPYSSSIDNKTRQGPTTIDIDSQGEAS